jgi:hypothetical protein
MGPSVEEVDDLEFWFENMSGVDFFGLNHIYLVVEE